MQVNWKIIYFAGLITGVLITALIVLLAIPPDCTRNNGGLGTPIIRRDTVVKSIQLPAVHDTIFQTKWKKVLIPENADTAEIMKYVMERDSLANLLDSLHTGRIVGTDTIINSDTVKIAYDEIRGRWNYEFRFSPKLVPVEKETIFIPVEVEGKRAWWEIPAATAAGTVIGVFIGGILVK